MNPHYTSTAKRAGHCCEYCLAPEAMSNFPFEVEHVIPGTRGGDSKEWNLALACRSCNLFKLDCISEIDAESNEPTRLFHPRIDSWDEHFAFDAESCELKGMTAAGRVTVARLRMNSPRQIEARRAWLELGVYPPDQSQ